MKKTTKRFQLPQLSKKTVFISVGVVTGVLFGFFFFGPTPKYRTGLASLKDLVKYARTTEENIQMDNADVMKPVFESTYKKKFAVSFIGGAKDRFTWLLNKVKLVSPPVFSFMQLQDLLNEVTRQQEKLNRKTLHVRKFSIEKDSTLVVFGILHAAYHSLTRDLLKLQDLKILDENFKIIKPKTSLFFLGNVTGRAPYSIETLTVLLKLMQQNPEQIFFMRGAFEFNETWLQHSLRQELEYVGRPFTSEPIPLSKEINAFFDTLPVEAYGIISYKKTNDVVPYIVLSSFIEDPALQNRTDEKAVYPDFIRGNDMVLELEKVVAKVDPIAKPALSLKATIRDIRKRKDFEPMDGMRRMAPQEGATAWTILSAPTPLVRKAVKFDWDAFVTIIPAERYADWKITVYHRHVDAKDLALTPREEAFFDAANAVEDQGVAPAAVAAKPAAAPAVASPVAEKPAAPTPVPAAPAAPVAAVPVTVPVVEKPAAPTPVPAAPTTPVAVATVPVVEKPAAAPAPAPEKPATPAAPEKPAAAPEKPVAAPVVEKPAAPASEKPAEKPAEKIPAKEPGKTVSPEKPAAVAPATPAPAAPVPAESGKK